MSCCREAWSTTSPLPWPSVSKAQNTLGSLNISFSTRLAREAISRDSWAHLITLTPSIWDAPEHLVSPSAAPEGFMSHLPTLRGQVSCSGVPQTALADCVCATDSCPHWLWWELWHHAHPYVVGIGRCVPTFEGYHGLPSPRSPGALPDPSELSPDLPLTNPKTYQENKPRKGYEREYPSFLQIHDLHLWSWGLCICPWCWTTPATGCPGLGSAASVCTGSAPRTSRIRSPGRLSGTVRSCPAWPRTCTGELEGQEKREDLRDADSTGEWWDVRGQNEEQEKGRCSRLLVPEAAWDLSRGVNNGGKIFTSFLKKPALVRVHPSWKIFLEVESRRKDVVLSRVMDCKQEVGRERFLGSDLASVPSFFQRLSEWHTVPLSWFQQE